jgi:hypothetical protein
MIKFYFRVVFLTMFGLFYSRIFVIMLGVSYWVFEELVLVKLRGLNPSRLRVNESYKYASLYSSNLDFDS